MLLVAGAEVDNRNDSDNPDCPWTTLASSCLQAHAGMMTQLLQLGADLACAATACFTLAGTWAAPCAAQERGA
eukprot:11075-Heterococcus_DN1.PRE.3